METTKLKRDVRVDVLRGLALLIIYTDHIEGNVFRQFTPQAVGFSDMAEAFFFLSGYVSGIAYWRRLTSQGLLMCQLRAVTRSLQLLAAHLVTLVVFVYVFWLCSRWLGGVYSVSPGITPSQFLDAPASTFQRLLASPHMPGEFGILPNYVVFVLFVPVVLVLSRLHAAFPLLLTTVLYACAQCLPDTFSPGHNSVICFHLNPYAWQLPFVLGVVLGLNEARAASHIPSNLAVFGIALVFLSSAFLFLCFRPDAMIHLAGRANLHPVRVLHFLCVAVVVRELMPPASDVRCTHALRPLVICGQNSLIVFCVGCNLSLVAGWMLYKSGDSLLQQGFANVSGWVVLLLVACLWGNVKKRVRVRNNCERCDDPRRSVTNAKPSSKT